MGQDSFSMNVKAIRERARQHIEEGAKTPGYKAKVETVRKLLNEALATELVCVLRYKRHYFTASGINSESVKTEFLQHATEEQQHADQIAERIVQLGRRTQFLPGRNSDSKSFGVCRRQESGRDDQGRSGG